MYAADKTLVVKMSLKRKSAASAGDDARRVEGQRRGRFLGTEVLGNLSPGGTQTSKEGRNLYRETRKSGS